MPPDAVAPRDALRVVRTVGTAVLTVVALVLLGAVAPTAWAAGAPAAAMAPAVPTVPPGLLQGCPPGRYHCDQAASAVPTAPKRTPTPTPRPTPTATATPTHQATHGTGRNKKVTASGHGTDWPLVVGVAVLLLALLGGLGLVVLRSGGRRQSDAHSGPGSHTPMHRLLPRTQPVPAGPPRSQHQEPPPRQAPSHAFVPAPRPADLRRATVCTDLHPQGYVDIDDCLYRAVWSDADTPPPAPGGPVGVARPAPGDGTQDPDVLLAFPTDPTDPQRRLHA